MVLRWLLRLAELLAFILLLPLLFWSRLPLPEYTTFTAPSQWLSFLPGYSGILLRRVWYRSTLRRCGSNLTVDWLAVIRTRETEIGDRCTLGVGNWVGWVRLGNDVMTGSHVVFVSGARQHGFNDVSRPMRQQHGQKSRVTVGNDVWIGAQTVVMADVSLGTVIGAGSIVTRQHPEMSVIAGNPARVLRKRGEGYEE
ncbi:MAG: acyltransferase [Thiobacillus sp.]|nr:acyltransferase [Thiobacillus sp.]